jgi:hypothetical protein
VDFAASRLLRVTAHLSHGAVLPTVFPAPLDGILAAADRRRRLSVGTVDHHVVCLPLVSTASIYGGPFGKQWVWAATCARWDGEDTDLRWVHQRWDPSDAERVVQRLPVHPEVGATKPWRIPVTATVTDRLTWTALGDPDGVRDLLDWRVGVGKRRGVGEGEVTRWEVSDAGPPDWEAIWWTSEGNPARPLPVRAADYLGIPDPPTVPHQIRPPYWRAAQTTVPGGGFARAPREVIAAWIQRF